MKGKDFYKILPSYSYDFLLYDLSSLLMSPPLEAGHEYMRRFAPIS
jgi:hypothetical protein